MNKEGVALSIEKHSHLCSFHVAVMECDFIILKRKRQNPQVTKHLAVTMRAKQERNGAKRGKCVTQSHFY